MYFFLSKTPSTESAHRQFMESYKSIFVHDSKLTGNPTHSFKRRLFFLNIFRILAVYNFFGFSLRKVTHEKEGDEPEEQTLSLGSSRSVASATDPLQHQKKKVEAVDDEPSHNIGDYISKMRKKKHRDDAETKRKNNIKILRKLLKKLLILSATIS